MSESQDHWEKRSEGGYALMDERGREALTVIGDPNYTLMMTYASLGDKEEARKYAKRWYWDYRDKHPERYY